MIEKFATSSVECLDLNHTSNSMTSESGHTPMAAWTIRRRLIGSMIVLVGVLWVIGAAITVLSVRHELNEIFDGVLRESAEQIIPITLLQQKLETSSVARTFAEMQATSPKLGHLRIVLRAADGTMMFRTSNVPSRIWPLPTKNGFHDQGKIRYLARFLPAEQAWIEVGQALRERQEAARGLLIGLASPLLALLPIAAIAVWRVVGRATEPIARVSREVSERGGNHLEAIGHEGLPAELTPVVDAVNTLMARLKAALDSERAFAADAAHELRNPLASARAQVQVLAGELAGTAGQARAENVASELSQLGRRIERILQISRAEAGLAQSGEHADLAAIAALLADDYRLRPGLGERLRVHDETSGASPVRMDQDALAIVLRNAIENAVSHGTAGEPITMRVTADRTVTITNACPLVTEETLAALKGRFRRGAGAREGGSGLGLAIIETIMRQAGGTVVLRSPAEGRNDGFEIALTFPGPP